MHYPVLLTFFTGAFSFLRLIWIPFFVIDWWQLRYTLLFLIALLLVGSWMWIVHLLVKTKNTWTTFLCPKEQETDENIVNSALSSTMQPSGLENQKKRHVQ
jgi:hypothetical protein